MKIGACTPQGSPSVNWGILATVGLLVSADEAVKQAETVGLAYRASLYERVSRTKGKISMVCAE